MNAKISANDLWCDVLAPENKNPAFQQGLLLSKQSIKQNLSKLGAACCVLAAVIFIKKFLIG